ncbi:helix-turn-helix transcriptional regulator [Halomarina ordinaria]|uniref:Helix-turn-helix transcriptional regulator n=1 Tax=Halomarina ordinaria TaxID=3033939 RepID=A0ABD5UBX1_9EURY|nr:helix-turn-helix domain-containing protein [Halomarina sp. PSRA2]
MIPRTTSGALADIEFLARSAHRVAVLDALTERPASRADLRSGTGASASTVGRALRAFEERGWVRRAGNRYEVTELGAFVSHGLRGLLERLETERALRDAWRWLPGAEAGFTVEMVTDAVVTTAEVDAPYRPVSRFASLLRETERFRFVGTDLALFEPCKDEIRRQIVDGMRTEIIDPPHVARYVLSTYRDHCEAAIESGTLIVRVHDDLPFYGVGLFDDRVAVSCYDEDSGTVQVLVDTDAPETREWAESTFEAYRGEARPLALEPTASEP